jgi:hypothetical protein
MGHDYRTFTGLLSDAHIYVDSDRRKSLSHKELALSIRRELLGELSAYVFCGIFHQIFNFFT